jgi:hypothetical protein
MADGALSSVVPNVGEEPKVDPLAQSQERINKGQADLQAQYERLMKLLDERESGETRPISLGQFFASLVGSPESKYFSQSMGDVSRNLQGIQDQQRKQEIENAKMRIELGTAQQGMLRENELSRALMGELSAGQSSPNIDAVAQAAGVSPNVARAMPPDLRRAVQLQVLNGDRKGAIETMSKFALENAKTPDQMKIQEWNISQFPPSLRPIIQQFIANNAVFGSAIDRTRAFTEIDKLVDESVISREQGNLYKSYLSPDILNKPVGTYSAPTAPAAAPVAVPTKRLPSSQPSPAGFPRVSPKEQGERDAGRNKILNQELDQEKQKLAAATTPDQRRIAEQNIASINRELGVSANPPVEPPTKRERELEAAESTERMKATVKRQSELESTWADDSERAKDEIRDARTVHKVVGENPAGFGLLSKPGSALAYAAQAGFRIGDKSVGINELEQSLLRSGKFTQQQINAVSIVHQIALKWQLAVASTQKGAVSNYERTLFGQAGLNVSDDPKIIQYKAALIDAQARNRQEVWQKYQEFKENNKRANIDDFKRSNTFLELQKQYDQKLDKIRDAYSK